MTNQAYRICTRCAMDTSDSDITFDEKGECNHCTDYFGRMILQTYKKGHSEKMLDNIISIIKKNGEGREYDCILGISGGVDSCYCAYLCKQWGLRVLLLHMDNGWDSEISVKNIKAVANKLGYEYMSYVLDWEEFKQIQLGFLKSSIVDLEIPTDIAIPASIYQTAVKYNIKYIISGNNYSGEGILPLTWGYHVLKDMTLYKHIVKTYSKLPLKKVPTVGLIGEFYYKFVRGIKSVYILNYIPYNKDEAREFLIKEFGWQYYGGVHFESKITAFWQSYAMPVKFNMDYRRSNMSSQICEGQMTREEVLEILKTSPYNKDTIENDKNYIAKKYGISREELDFYLNQPPKTYKDFPNSRNLIKFVYKVYTNLYPNKRF
jgi:N-acetyl sugar amidotransferase